jgi:hypothetical protein
MVCTVMLVNGSEEMDERLQHGGQNARVYRLFECIGTVRDNSVVIGGFLDYQTNT